MLLAEIIIDLFFLVLVIVFLILLFYGIYSFCTGAPFVPTGSKIVKEMIEMANLKSGETVLDLGSGDGRIVFSAVKTGAYCLGIEINPILCYFAKLKAFFKKSKNIEFKRADFWNYNLDKVDVMFLYFIPDKMDKLRKKIKKEMKFGARIISHGFTFPNWQYKEKNGKIYLYEISKPASG